MEYSYILILFNLYGFIFASTESTFESKGFCTKYTNSALFGHLTSFNYVTPTPINCPLGCLTYIQATSALGLSGPLGSLG